MIPNFLCSWLPRDSKVCTVQDVEANSIASFMPISKAVYCAMVVVIQMVCQDVGDKAEVMQAHS